MRRCQLLAHFPEKWMPVFRPKMRKIINLEPHFDSIKMRKALAALLFLCLGILPVAALEPDEIIPDAAKEQRARALSGQLRCLVCQNQSIDDSAAPLARDLRTIVRQRVLAGESDEAIKGFLVDRYGEFILLKPPFAANTVLLWSLPFGGLVIGALFLVLRRRITAQPAELDGEERRRLDALLQPEAPDDG